MAKKGRLVLEGILVAGLVAVYCVITDFALQLGVVILIGIAILLALVELLSK